MVATGFPAIARSQVRPAQDRAIRAWLLVLILLVFAMVVVGGATRLTESGLSITEWKPVSGAIPPLAADAWQAAYDLYRQSPQYKLLNAGMSLEDFQRIYWWEWAHRELGRLIGLIYISGFLWFAIRRAIPARTVAILAAMGVLLAMQGVVGWIMVRSGLQPGMTAVAPIKLTLHLTLASLFFAAVVAMFVRLRTDFRESATPGATLAAWCLVALALAQVALGGLVAGHDAGLTYNTWPLMDGKLVPSGLGLLRPAWLNVVDNVTAIQFNHRVGAYLLTGAILAYAVWQPRHATRAFPRAFLLLALVVAQMVLGIATLVQVVPIHLALAHQGMAMILLLALTWNAAVLSRRVMSPGSQVR